MERAVVFRLSALGDVALTTGVLERWRGLWGTRFVFVTRSGPGEILRGHPAVEEVVVPDEARMEGLSWWTQAGELARRFQGLPLIDLHGTLRSRMLALRWKGPVHRYPKFGLLRRLHRLTRSPGLARRLEATSVPQRYALALEDAPPDPALVRPRIVLDPAELEQGRELAGSVTGTVTGSVTGRGPRVVLHPFATHPDKEWPREHWRVLAQLLEEAGYSWLVIGRNEEPVFPGDRRDLTGATDLRATCGVLAACDVLVTNDSGPMHLATGVGLPVVALFGPTSRAWGFFPQGPLDRVLERTDLACRPCSLHGRGRCANDRACLAAIPPRQVLDAVRSMLLSRSGTGSGQPEGSP